MSEEQQTATLRIHTNANLRVFEVQGFLSALDKAYGSLLLFVGDTEIIARSSSKSEAQRLWSAGTSLYGVNLDQRLKANDRLVLRQVELHSPGFWDFVGLLSPLRAIELVFKLKRESANDNEERRKDREYRDKAEERRLHLENKLREVEVVKKQLALLRDMGATDKDFGPLLERLIYEPLSQLEDISQRIGVQSASIIDAKDTPPEL
jgi:hypothetical protein